LIREDKQQINMTTRPKTDGGGRGAGRNRNNARNRPPRQAGVTTTKFKGACEALDGHIFDFGANSSADGFIRTKKKIEEYVGVHFDQGSNIRISIENGVLFTVAIPVEPVNPPIPAVLARARIPAVVADPVNGVIGQPEVPAVLPVAAIPNPPLTRMQEMMLAGEIKGYQTELRKLTENVKKAYSLVLGQCTENLKS
jgi:hypothetical protein